MESRKVTFLVLALFAAIASQNVVNPAMGCEESRCSRKPHHRSRSGGYYSSPPTHHSSSSGHHHHKKRSPTPSPKSSPPKSTGCPPTQKPPTSSPPTSSPPRRHRSKSRTTPAPTPRPTPSTPMTPTTPSIPRTPIRRPPIFDTPITGTCPFWRARRRLVRQILRFWGNIPNMFGSPLLLSMFGGAVPSIHQALSWPGTDGFGSLMRESAAALLNSMANPRGYPFSTNQVQSYFVDALVSESAAATQAQLFKDANEGHY